MVITTQERTGDLVGAAYTARMLLLLLALHPALASDSWSDPAPGVRLLRRTTSEPQRIFALEVDLCARGVSLRATAEDERERTVSSFGALVGAQAAVNGDFFSYDGYYTSGMAIGDGTLWNADTTSEGFVAFGRDHAVLSPPAEDWGSPSSWMGEAVGGRPHLVIDGVAGSGFTDPSHCSADNPRTAVGMSQDRRTLWLVVVDGRSSDSDGMTCDALAALMLDLGAWTALNLDGGGSSALWVEGEGAVNEPSDGSERVVANHLAVLASGSGAPESCDYSQDEVYDQAGVLDALGTTDVDGDGRADACARAAASFRCQPSTGTGFGDPWTITDLSNDAGFSDEPHYASIRMADVTGDHLADVCARGPNGFTCWPSTGTAFGASIAGPALTDAAGWSDVSRASTLRLGDIDGDGSHDLCARDASGISCYRATGTGFDAALVGPELSDAAGWAHPQYYGTLRLGDIDGDGKDDMCARAGAGMWCWRSNGAGFPDRIDGPVWSDAAGWDDVQYWSTIRLDDIDGDTRADLCGRGPLGYECWLSDGSGFPTYVAGPTLSDDSGWDDHSNYATIRLADTDADGDLDLCARANAGMYCWLYDAGAYATRIDGPLLSDDSGWDDPRFYTTLRMGDVDADGKADLCGRDATGLGCWSSTGSGFTDRFSGPEWSDASGWAEPEYYTTIRVGGGSVPAPPDPGDSAGVDTGPPAAGVSHNAESGCGCSSGGAGGAAIPMAAAFLLLGARRRFRGELTRR